MKRYILTILIAMASIFETAAQKGNPVEGYLRSMGSSTICFTMSGTGLDGTAFKAQEGKMDLQFPNFRIEVAGHIVCEKGEDIWIYNPQTSEVVISGNVLASLINDSSITVGNDGKPVLDFNNKNGSKMTFILKKTEPHTKWPASHFIMDTKTLGDDVIVTDLR